RIEGIILTIVDVTEMKEANLKLKEMTTALQARTTELEQSEKSWKSLVENTPDIVARIDENATVLYINQSLSQTGLVSMPIVGINLLELEEKNIGIKYLNQKIQQVINSKQVLNFYQDFTLEDKLKNFYITLIPE